MIRNYLLHSFKGMLGSHGHKRILGKKGRFIKAGNLRCYAETDLPVCSARISLLRSSSATTGGQVKPTYFMSFP